MTKHLRLIITTTATIVLSLCLLGCSSESGNASTETPEVSKDTILGEVENAQVHDYTVDLVKGYESPDSLTEYQTFQLKYPESQRVFYTISKHTLSSSRENADAEHDPTVNSALMKIKSGMSEEVQIDNHVGALTKNVNGSDEDASYNYTVEWFVGNTSYSIGFTYDGKHVDQLKPYAESFYKTIKMIQ